MLALNDNEQSWFVGIRSTFYRISSIFGQGILLTIAGILETKTENIPLAWQLTLLLSSILFGIITIWHIFFLPKAEISRPTQTNAKAILKDFAKTFVSFFRKKGIVIALCFMLIYRLPEAFLIKIINPFFVSAMENGGLALSTWQVGVAYGTIGIVLLTIGGILGGWYASKKGLRQSLWIMALAITLPDIVYLLLSIFQTNNIYIVTAAIAIEQFGYGFGFTAYMLYLIYFSQGEFKTAHYALCTAFMALGMMLPGYVAGYLQEAVGYTAFFSIVMACCLLTLLVTALIYNNIDKNFGKDERTKE